MYIGTYKKFDGEPRNNSGDKVKRNFANFYVNVVKRSILLSRENVHYNTYKIPKSEHTYIYIFSAIRCSSELV